MSGTRIHNSSGESTDGTGSCKSNYHAITAKTALHSIVVALYSTTCGMLLPATLVMYTGGHTYYIVAAVLPLLMKF
jgi:hypothetical protein